MTQRDQANSRLRTSINLNGAAGARLIELAQEQGIAPGRLAKDILEEILPKIDSVQHRVAIKLRGTVQ